MLKQLITLVAAIVVLFVAFIAYEQIEKQTLAHGINAQLDDIATQYGTLIDHDLPPLAATHSFTAGQSFAVQKLDNERADIKAAATLTDKVNAVHALQMSLATFLREGTPTQPFLNDPAFIDLSNEMGKGGHMRALLNAYNEAAIHWNDSQEDPFRVVADRILGQKNELLPYLRFDGNLEYYTTISL
jgi:hypothetical protein